MTIYVLRCGEWPAGRPNIVDSPCLDLMAGGRRGGHTSEIGDVGAPHRFQWRDGTFRLAGANPHPYGDLVVEISLL